MNQPTKLGRRFLRVGLYGFLAVFLVVIIFPSVEATRLESRIQTACNDVREIARTINLNDSTTRSQYRNADPWGQPYRIERVEGKFRAISSGPDMIASHDESSGDDIWSGMSPTPADLITIAKQRRILAALLILLIWVMGSTVYLTIGLRRIKVN